jgi:hypothetical protein
MRKTRDQQKNIVGTVFTLAMVAIFTIAAGGQPSLKSQALKNKGGLNGDNTRDTTTTIRNLESEPRERSDSNKLLVGNQPAERFANNAELQILNKITGKVHKIRAKIDKDRPVIFERLEIILLSCWKSFPEENPENKLLLRIFETNQHDRKKRLIFYGWIFSSTPSVSGLEHSLYDVELKDCM